MELYEIREVLGVCDTLFDDRNFCASCVSFPAATYAESKFVFNSGELTYKVNPSSYADAMRISHKPEILITIFHMI